MDWELNMPLQVKIAANVATLSHQNCDIEDRREEGVK